MNNLPTMAALFTAAGFSERKRGQHRDKNMLPLFFFEGHDSPHKVQVLGQFNGTVGFGDPAICDAIVVTLPDGTRVPCYRQASPDNNYCICQLYNFKATK